MIALDARAKHDVRSGRVPLDAGALDHALGEALRRLAARLDALLLQGEGTSPEDVRALRLLTTDALHALVQVVEARDVRGFGTGRFDRILRQMTAAFGRSTGAAVDVRVRGDVARVPRDVGETLLELAREAFSNVSRNGRSTVAILTVTVDDDVVVLEITDDGVDLAQRQVGAWHAAVDLGLARMRRTAAAAGGRLVVTGLRPRGLRLRTTLPLAPGGRP